MADTSGGWSKNQRDWFYRIAQKASKNERTCLKKAGFYRKIVALYLKAAQKTGNENLPDGIWRYAMMMESTWIRCSEVWGEIADTFLAKVKEIDCPDMPVDEIDEN